MGWFDTPTISIRKQIPERFHSALSSVESFAFFYLEREAEQHRAYQMGIVLALWVKAAEMSDKLVLTSRESKNVQSVYESCVKALRGESYQAFRVLVALAEQDGTIGVPSSYISNWQRMCCVNELAIQVDRKSGNSCGRDPLT